MDTSILTSIKKMLGIDDDYTHFDTDIIININSVFMKLNQLGVGPIEGYSIADKVPKWIDFIGEKKDSQAIITFTYLNVRLLFDPPSNSFMIDAMERQIKEYEWRLNIQAEETVYE